MAASDPHDQVAELIRSRRGKQQAITSGEIKDELEIDDGEAQPKTREIIREVIDEYQIPIGAGPQGYWVIQSETELEDYLGRLQERKAGIQHRKELVEDAWDQWTERPPGQLATDGAGVQSADQRDVGPSLDFQSKLETDSDSWARADPHAALIERVSAHGWRVTLPDGEDAHTASLVLDDGDYVGTCNCDGYHYHDGACAHLCTIRQADWHNRHFSSDLTDVTGQLVQVLEVRDEGDYLADEFGEPRADGGKRQ